MENGYYAIRCNCCTTHAWECDKAIEIAKAWIVNGTTDITIEFIDLKNNIISKVDINAKQCKVF